MTSDKGGAVLAVAIVFATLSWTSTTLRAIVRAGMLRKYGIDDWTMLITQIFFTAYLVCQIGGVVYGTGRHLADLDTQSAERALRFWFFCELFYIVATAMMKISICFFLLRVATHCVHIWILRFLIALASLCGTAFFFTSLFQCSPIGAWWTLEPHKDKCMNVHVVMGILYGSSGLIVVADWCLAILPIFIVKDLPMEPKQRILVAFILAIAAFGSTATIVRLPFIGALSESYEGRNADFLYDTVGVAIWTTVEVGVGITAGSVATLRPLIRKLLNQAEGVAGGSHIARARKSISSPVPLDMVSASRDLNRKGYQSFPSPEVSQEQLASFDFGINKTPAIDDVGDFDDDDDDDADTIRVSRWRRKR